MDRVAVYPGTFDPVTNGHIDLMERSLRLFDRIYVGVFDNLSKSVLFSNAERIEMIRKATAHLRGIEVESFHSLLVDYAKARGGCAIIRGLRAVSDFDYEFQLATMSRHLSDEVDYVFLTPSEQFMFISSTLVREIAGLGGDVTKFVHPMVDEALRTAWQRRKAVK